MARLDRGDLVLVGLALLFKLGCNLQEVDWGRDGGYYADVARNVAAGRGLASSISMFHEGLPSFPHPTPIYPLWPLLLGAAAAVVPLEVAAVWLPSLFYVLLPLIVGPIGRAFFAGRPFAAAPGVDHGHLLGLLFVLSNRLVEFSSKPYTEALSTFLLAAALLRGRPFFAEGGLRRGAEWGAWAFGLWMVRGPFVVLSAALLIGAWAALADPTRRGGRARGAVAATAVFGALAAAAAALHFDRIPGGGLDVLVRFDQWRVQPGLSPLTLLVEAEGPADWLADRASGVLVAFSPEDARGYTPNFGLLPWALLAVAPGWWAARGAWGRSLWAALTAPDGAWRGCVVGVGLTQVLVLHVIHKGEFAEWNFSMRHALPAWWAFAPLGLAALRADGLPGLLGRFVFAASLGHNLILSLDRPDALSFDSRDRKAWAAGAAVLRVWATEDPDLRVGTSDAQPLSRFAPGVGLITTHSFTTLDDLDTMARRDGMDRLLLPRTLVEKSTEHDFIQDRAAFAARWVEIPIDAPQYRAYRPAAPAEAP